MFLHLLVLWVRSLAGQAGPCGVDKAQLWSVDGQAGLEVSKMASFSQWASGNSWKARPQTQTALPPSTAVSHGQNSFMAAQDPSSEHPRGPSEGPVLEPPFLPLTSTASCWLSTLTQGGELDSRKNREFISISIHPGTLWAQRWAQSCYLPSPDSAKLTRGDVLVYQKSDRVDGAM